jgi:UDP-N-acetylmuramoyl-L-alanyl-D-glutamate--2,6-diaminopimelate ligase
VLKIGKLAACLPEAVLQGDTEVDITGIAYDSRQVKPGDLFVCIQGFRFDGHLFIDDAVEKGAAAVAAEEGRELEHLSVPVIYVPDSRQALGLLSACFYDYPSRKLRLIGVTGTNGKTTTTYLIKSILECAGHKVGLVGTIQNMIGDKVIPAEHTTPEASDLQGLFSQMAEDGCTFAVMEVSSHALSLERTTGTEFDIAVFTNLTQDHLDFHSSLQHYLNAKTRLFAELERDEENNKAAVLNADDEHSIYIAERSKVPVITYGIEADADFRAVDIDVRPEGLSYLLEHEGEALHVRLSITGHFNVYNSLAALAACWAAGVELDTAVKGLNSTPLVPGRLEPVSLGQGFAVMVDYAHTPDGLENVLKTVRGLTQGRSIVVFGCGGDRDKGKRAVMGEIAGRLADVVIVTSDNPRSESPELICEAIGDGVRRTIGGKPWEIIVDRRQAIRRAIMMAEAGDTVLIAGKGHEDYQILKDGIIHFDDREEASRALRERLGQK